MYINEVLWLFVIHAEEAPVILAVPGKAIINQLDPTYSPVVYYPMSEHCLEN